MNKKIIFLIFFLIPILFLSCSFDNKTGIWSGSEKERRRISQLEKDQNATIDIIQIYTSKNIYKNEVLPKQDVILKNPIKNTSWIMPGMNLQNLVGNIYLSGIENNFLKKKIGKNKFKISKIKSSPLFIKESIIFADDTGTIFKLNRFGKVKWKKNIYKKLYKKIYKNLALVVNEDKIFVSDNIGFIYAISLNNGRLIWIKNHGIPLKSNIKVFKNKIFLINQENRILCFDAEQGNKVWDVRTTSSFIKTQYFLSLAISKKGDLLALNSSGDLLKIRADNGSVVWNLNTSDSLLATDTDFFKSSDIVVGDNDIIFTTVKSIKSFNLSSAYLNWKKKIISSNTPIVTEKNVFLVTDNGYFVNFDRLSGETIWSLNIFKVLKKKKRETLVTGFIMGSGKIYATTSNGYIIICSATSGNVESFKKIGEPIASSPIIINGSFYILTEKPRILGYN